MKTKLSQCVVVLMLCFTAISQASAQDTTANKNKWHFLLQPYLMFPTMDGKIGIGRLPDASIHASASDIFSHLQFGAMAYFEAYSNKWALTSDMVYMDLSQAVEGKKGILSGDAGAKQFIWEVAGLRRFNPWFDAGIGLRLVNLQSSLNIDVDSTVPGGGGNRSASISETWVDPIIIGRVKLPAGKKWMLQLRGDIGGFGIGSELTWQLQGDVAYRFSKLFQLGLGYRIIAIDYEKGTGNERFLYDVNTYGPVIRFGFNF